jgi:precorrin-3B synthase
VLRTLAEECGDGGLELTSRANVQLRALRDTSPATLAARLSAAGLLPSETHETVRNIAAPPLAGAAVRDLVRALDEALCADPALAVLPGRFLFAVGAVDLVADVAAVPVGDEFAVLLAGEDRGLRVPADGVVPGLLAAAHAFLTERAERPGGPAHPPDKPGRTGEAGARRTAWRLQELFDGPARVAARMAGHRTSVRSPTTAGAARGDSLSRTAGLVGVIAQADGLFAAGALVPLGRLTGVPMRVLAKAERLVVSPGRGVLVPDLAPDAAREWLGELAACGLAVAGDSRWAGVTACAGRPGCAKSLADVRADAAQATRFVAGLPVHWTGCARGCGSPAAEHVRVEATAGGYLVDRRPPGPAAPVAEPVTEPVAGPVAGPVAEEGRGEPAGRCAGEGRLGDLVAAARRR